jgi:hypothetical protein
MDGHYLAFFIPRPLTRMFHEKFGLVASPQLAFGPWGLHSEGNNGILPGKIKTYRRVNMIIAAHVCTRILN